MSTDNFINVHTFDGNLKGIFKPVHVHSRDEKIVLFNRLIEKLNCGRAISIVKIIINDMSKPNNGDNYQVENDIDCTDILADIVNKVLTKEYSEMLGILEEQLSDILSLGVCPSGRTTRLLQIWNTFN
jgi:hypothetical protein